MPYRFNKRDDKLIADLHTDMKWESSTILFSTPLGPCLAYALSCQDITIPVSIHATNKQLPKTLNAQSLNAVTLQSVLSLPDVPISGDFVIGATFCEPTTETRTRHNTLQVLVHGAAYNRTYWSSLGLDEPSYNWVKYAANQGYPTLAIDRLCNGVSSHPNGLICQIPSEGESLHALAQIARSGALPIGSSSRSFNRLVYVCHSVGSDLCSYNARIHPSDADVYILTGWSNKLLFGIPGISYGQPLPASYVYPRYSGLGSEYLTFASKSGQRYLSYYGSFVPTIQNFDYATQGTFTVGEAFTTLISQLPATKYTGGVLLLNGNEDATYCQTNAFDSLRMVTDDCSAGVSSGTQSNFPNAYFEYYVTGNTGHCLNLHSTAQSSFHVAHNFLTRRGL